MEIITLNEENIGSEHICCDMSGDAKSKKDWLRARFADGLRFKKLDVRGKCFIEYIPAERAWAAIDAENYFYIDCLWVAGKYAKSGYGRMLLEAAIADAKEQQKSGLVILSSDKKRPFMSDPAFLSHFGFLTADTAEPYFKLMYLPLADNAAVPSFAQEVRNTPSQSGLVLYYSNQCPYTAKYVPLLAQCAEQAGVPLQSVFVDSCELAQSIPSPASTYSLFYDGRFVTNEIMSVKKFGELIEKLTKAEKE